MHVHACADFWQPISALGPVPGSSALKQTLATATWPAEPVLSLASRGEQTPAWSHQLDVQMGRRLLCPTCRKAAHPDEINLVDARQAAGTGPRPPPAAEAHIVVLGSYSTKASWLHALLSLLSLPPLLKRAWCMLRRPLLLPASHVTGRGLRRGGGGHVLSLRSHYSAAGGCGEACEAPCREHQARQGAEFLSLAGPVGRGTCSAGASAGAHLPALAHWRR